MFGTVHTVLCVCVCVTGGVPQVVRTEFADKRTDVPLNPILLVGERVAPCDRCARQKILLADTNVTTGIRTWDHSSPSEESYLSTTGVRKD